MLRSVSEKALQFDQSLTRAHISTKVFRSYILYLQEHFPQIDIALLCETAGLPLKYIQDDNNWVSFSFDEKFTYLLVQATGDSDLCHKVGRFALSPKAMGNVMVAISQLFLNIRGAYSEVIRLASHFNRHLEVKMTESTCESVTLRFDLIFKDLAQADRNSLQKNLPNIIANTQGYLSAVPTLLQLPPALVEISEQCVSENSSWVEYKCSFKADKSRFAVLSWLFGFMLSVGAGFFFRRIMGLQPLASVTSGAICFVLFLLYRALTYGHEMSKHVQDTFSNLDLLNKRYIDLQSARESLHRRLRETELLKSMIEKLAGAHSAENVLELSCQEIIATLKYDRCIVFLADSSKTKLIAANAAGLPAALKERLTGFVLEIDISSTDPKKVSNVFRTSQPILIDDVQTHFPTLGPESQGILTLLNTTSFICVPIESDQNKHGVLCIDYNRSDRALSLVDLDIMIKVGQQIAVSLDREVAKARVHEATLASQKLQEEFLANTTHELKTPIHGIIGLLDNVIDSPIINDNSEIANNLTLARKSSDRLLNLVNSILDYSKIKHRERRILRKSLNLAAHSRSVTALLAPIAEKKGIVIHNLIAEQLPPVEADPESLLQVLQNLIGNAVKFTETGSITITASLIGNQIEVSVTDTGIGIPESQHEIVFQEFRQANASSQRKYDGTGLGLAIVKSLVELNNGTIRLKSRVGVGSTFTFTLPCSLEKAEDTVIQVAQVVSSPRSSRTPQTAEERLIIPAISVSSGRTVLVVDDDEINRHVIAAHLGRDFKIVQCSSGPSALQTIGSGLVPDIILLDVMMPELDGYQTAAEIRRTLPSHTVPIIFLTAKDREEDLIRGFEAGGNDYLTKPFSKRILERRVAVHIEVAQYARSFQRFVPKEIMRLLDLSSALEINAGQARALELSVVFADLRGFSAQVGLLEPLEAFEYLNRIYHVISPLVNHHGGWIDKYIGDCIMACFPNSPEDAISFAVDSALTLRTHAATGLSKLQPRMGIGLSRGMTALGWLGSDSRVDGTVVSNAVNIASRLEKLTKELGSTLLITETSLSPNGDPKRFVLRRLGKFDLAGPQTQDAIIEVLSAEPENIREKRVSTLPIFQVGIEAFENRLYSAASDAFAEVMSIDFSDTVAEWYLRLSESRKVSEADSQKLLAASRMKATG